VLKDVYTIQKFVKPFVFIVCTPRANRSLIQTILWLDIEYTTQRSRWKSELTTL
jgi:hypothetical protein